MGYLSFIYGMKILIIYQLLVNYYYYNNNYVKALPNIPNFISSVRDGIGNYLLFTFSGATAWLFDLNTNSIIREYTPGHAGVALGAKYLHVFIIICNNC